jgi:hypothetical protein
MTGLAITPTAILHDSLTSARSGVLPAIIGALGAALSLNLMAPLFAPAIIPISVLGVVLGLRSRNLEAVLAGGLAIVCAMVALLNSDLFWLGFGVVASALSAA